MINWVFDDPYTYRTMTACPDTVIGDDLSLLSGRFPIPNLFRYWQHSGRLSNNDGSSRNVHGLDNRPERYIYNIGTWIEPHVWAGMPGNESGFASLFDIIPAEVMEDARNGRALVILDGLNEGFYDDELYGFMHSSMQQRSMPPSSLMYVTSNSMEPEMYAAWADENRVVDRMHVISFCHWQYQFRQYSMRLETPTWEDHRRSKSKNSKLIKTFNCLNRFKRLHREYLMLMLINSGLHQQGIISHDTLEIGDWEGYGIPPELISLSDSILPLTVDDRDFSNNKAANFNPDIYNRSWISVVTETHAVDEPGSFFISEKTWKPIFALQPFMILGHACTLEKLQGMGYKTFHGLIDESYDKMKLIDRVNGIVNNLTRLHAIRDKWSWLESCRDICLHNQRVFMANDFFDSKAYRDIINAYNNLSV